MASDAGVSVQLIYRYFGGKEGLYIAVLENTYSRIRGLERQLDLRALPPVDGMRRLVEFTFDYLRDNPDFVAIIRNENMLEGRFIRGLDAIADQTKPLIETIEDLLRRGTEAGTFRRHVDTLQLYVTILSLSITHLAQRHTLSVMLRRDLSEAVWLAERRSHAVDVLLAYLTAPTTVRAEEQPGP